MATHDLMYDSDANVYMSRIQTHLIFPKILILPPLLWLNPPKKHQPFFPCSRMFRLFLMSTFLLQV